jgi:hypothetical protein
MSSFAPGTPKSVMDEFNKKFYGSKQSQVDESPPQAERAKGLGGRIQKKGDNEAQAMLNEAAAKKAKADAAAAEKERAARLKKTSSLSAPEMPIFSIPPTVSDSDKAKKAVEIEKKIKANTPPPVLPSRTVNRPFFQNSRPPVQPSMQTRQPIVDARTGVDDSGSPPLKKPAFQMPPPIIGGQNTNSPTSPPVQPTPSPPVQPTPKPSFTPTRYYSSGPMDEPLDIGPAGPMKKGGQVKAKPTSKVKPSNASSRGDGIAQRGKTKGRIC